MTIQTKNITPAMKAAKTTHVIEAKVAAEKTKKDSKKGTKHTFSCYTESSNIPMPAEAGQEIVVHDADLAHRLFNVLRMEEGDKVELFDGIRVITLTVGEPDRKARKVRATVVEHHMIVPRHPVMTVGIGFLKRDALEQAVYSAAQMGACTIVPVITAKSRQRWSHQMESDRLEKIITSACEQAKNYSVPTITEPMSLESYLKIYQADRRIFFEVDGEPMKKLVKSLSEDSEHSISITIGPEGGFVPDEVEKMKTEGLVPYTLTPTVLRAHDAVCLGVGAVSSVLYKELKLEKATQ